VAAAKEHEAFIDHDLFDPGIKSGFALVAKIPEMSEELIKSVQQDLFSVLAALHIPAAERHHGVRQVVEEVSLRSDVARSGVLYLF
jgi:hypothetical protein